MSIRHLDAVFNPSSVAVIGASNNPKSIGGLLIRNILKAGFNGPIMPVNPKYQAVAGILTYPDVASLPLTPDVAVICTGPSTIPSLIEQLGERGTKGAVVITAGLSDHKHADGSTIEDAMLAAAKPHLMRIMGPNCVGLMIPKLGLNASFAHTDIKSGSLAFVSQSGGFCTATLDWAKARGIGFSHFISLGNSADIDFGDMLDYLASDPETSAILLYMESIGADEARKFMSAGRSAARNKPVLVIKSGRNAEGARAAASHTGALAGSDNVYDAALRRAGLLRVFNMDELFDAVETLARARHFHGDRLAILTNGGGPGVIATDALIEQGGKLAEFSPDTIRKLNDVLPGTWSHANPVDMIGDADARTYQKSLRVLMDDPGVDAILVVNAPSAIAPPAGSARGIVNLVREADMPILTSWVGGEAAGLAREIFAEAGIATYDTPENAVRAFMHMVRYNRNQEILTQVPPSLPTEFTPTPAAAKAVIDQVLLEQRDLLTEHEAKKLLAAYDIPVVETRVAADPDEAVELAQAIGFPVVLKILSPDISHKSDVGGVALGLGSPDEVRTTAHAMQARIAKQYSDIRLPGFTVQKMIRRPKAQELIIGVTTDLIFGPVILFGRGGTAVEVIADREVALPPLNMSLARHLISRTQVSKLLKGYRDRPAADLDAICMTLVQISQLVVDRPEIVELDINPLFADNRGVLALDARVLIAPAAETPGAERLAIRPYPRELEETIKLPGGEEIFVRPIRPEDQPAHRKFIKRITPEDLRFRLGVNRDIPPTEMARMVQIDYDREMAFIATRDDPHGESETLAVVRIIANPDNTEADFAVLARSDLKSRGIGAAMTKKMIDYCKNRGIGAIFGQILADNQAMLTLTKKLGFTHEPSSEPGRIKARLTLK